METVCFGFKLSCCPFCPKGADIGVNLVRRQVWAPVERGLGWELEGAGVVETDRNQEKSPSSPSV